MNSGDDNFENIVGGNYGRLEAQVGPELYQTQVDMNKAATEANRKHVELLESQRVYGIQQTEIEMVLAVAKTKLLNAVGALIAVFVLLLALGGLAVIVQLWKGVF